MPRGKSPFSLQRRPANRKEAEKKRQGKKYRYIYYAQFRDQLGDYTSAVSTGESSEGAARAWAMDYLRKGNVPVHGGFTFAKYATNWWIPGKCTYLNDQEASGHKKSPKYINESRRNLDNRLIPYFGKKKLSSIRPEDIMRWKYELYKNGDPVTGRKLNPATINRSLATLKVMLKEAVKLGYLQTNPAADIGILKEDAKAKGTLTTREAAKLLDENTIDTVWAGDYYHHVLNYTAAHTAMRLGEILALRPESIKDGALLVEHSWNGTEWGLGDTKTHQGRSVPIGADVERHLREILTRRTQSGTWDLLFALHDDGSPAHERQIINGLYEAIHRIGITEEERSKRNITFHSWRAFWNTQAIMRGMNEHLIRKVTGHATAQMTGHYTRPNTADLRSVLDMQRELLHESQ